MSASEDQFIQHIVAPDEPVPVKRSEMAYAPANETFPWLVVYLMLLFVVKG